MCMNAELKCHQSSCWSDYRKFSSAKAEAGGTTLESRSGEPEVKSFPKSQRRAA